MLIGAYFTLRTLASLGRSSSRFADTAGFFSVDYLGRESRLWPVPLLYSIVTNDTIRVALHILIGTVAWAFLAHVVARHSRFPRTVSVIILLFGLTPQIIRFDLAILSESLGISLLIMLIATTVQYLQTPSAMTLWLWVANLAAFSMVRASQLVVLFAITFVAVVSLIQRRSVRRITFATVLVVLSMWAGVQLRNNRSMSELNLYTVLQDRVIPDDARFEWFTSEGMPVTDDMRGPLLYDQVSDLPGELLDYVKLPIAQLPPSLIRLGGLPLAEWVREDGWSTYIRYVVTHPSDTWSRLVDLSTPTLNPLDRDLLPLENRTLIPRMFFLPWQWWAIAGAFATIFHLRFGQRYFAQLFASTCTLGLLWYAGVVLTSGIEHPRHAISIAVAIRVVSLVTILGLFSVQKPTPVNAQNVIP
jgi:hypothetical protein